MTQPDGKKEHYWNRANVIFAGVATLCAVVTAVYLISDHQRRDANAGSASTTTVSSGDAGSAAGLLIGRWEGQAAKRAIQAHAGASDGAMEGAETFDFQSGGVLTASYSVVFSEFVVNRRVSVVCKGVAMGKWNLSTDKLLIRFDEGLFVALDSATDRNVHLSGAEAEASGLHCPDTPLVPRGYSSTQNVVELTADSLQLQTIETTGQGETMVYRRIR